MTAKAKQAKQLKLLRFFFTAAHNSDIVIIEIDMSPRANFGRRQGSRTNPARLIFISSHNAKESVFFLTEIENKNPFLKREIGNLCARLFPFYFYKLKLIEKMKRNLSGRFKNN